MIRKIILISVILVCLFPLSFVEAEKNNLRKQFTEISQKTIWPVKGTSVSDIISPYGPRWLGRYDWHYGLDINAETGTKVKAVYQGEVWGIETFSDGNKTVILKHEFSEGARFKNMDMPYFYTWYMHLEDFKDDLEEGQTIKKGKVIGYVGSTGNAGSPHLHLELIAGEVWSQAYNGAGYDPAINPMFLFGKQNNSLKLELTQKPTESQDGIIRITTSKEKPVLNKIKFRIKNKNTGKIKKKHILNLNHRTGFNASSISTLDTPDTTKPYLSPVEDSMWHDDYYIDIVIPKEYSKKYLDSKFEKKLYIKDIWGRGKSTSW